VSLRDDVVEISHRLHARGWVANHDGNVTAREGAGRYVATPTATSKAAVDLASLLVVDDRGERVAGNKKPFGEIGLHLTIYQNRPDVHAVVHAHPPAATAIACSGGRQLDRLFIAEAVVSLGPSVPTVPFAAPGAAACAALAPFVGGVDAVLLGNHGALAWGADLEQAYLRLELVEHLARIALDAEKLGGVRPVPDEAIPALLEARKKAGFVVAAAPGQKPVVACAPAPHSDVPTIPPGGAPDLVKIIREELVRALKE
jgi:L-fuculose-phosphate aldolase